MMAMFTGATVQATTPDPIYSPNDAALVALVEPELRRLSHEHRDAMISAHTTLGAYVAVLGSEQVIGFAAAELVDCFAYDLIHEDDLVIAAQSHRRRLQGEDEPRLVRYRLRGADASYVAVETSTVLRRKGELEALICVTRRASAPR